MSKSSWFLLVFVGQFVWATLMISIVIFQHAMEQNASDMTVFDAVGLILLFAMLPMGIVYAAGWSLSIMRSSRYPKSIRSGLWTSLGLGIGLMLLSWFSPLSSSKGLPLSDLPVLFFGEGLFGGFLCGLILLGLNRLFIKVPPIQ